MRFDVMPRKPSKQEIAYEFRYALVQDLSEADRLLSVHSDLIDRPVYGDSETALHYFSVEDRPEIVTWLIARGADPNGIAEDDSPLHGASQLGNEEVCRLLLEAGANPNSKDSVEETPLHKASASGKVAAIHLLLRNGADPSIADMCGELPIDQALPRKRDQIRAAFDEHSDTKQNRA